MRSSTARGCSFTLNRTVRQITEMPIGRANWHEFGELSGRTPIRAADLRQRSSGQVLRLRRWAAAHNHVVNSSLVAVRGSRFVNFRKIITAT